MHDLKGLLADISRAWDFQILKGEVVVRRDAGNGTILLKLSAPEGLFFFKQVPAHSEDNHLENIYALLDGLTLSKVRLALPLRSREKTFCEVIGGKISLVFPFVSHSVLAESELEPSSVLEGLLEFHEAIKGRPFLPHPFKTYNNWFERAIPQLRGRVGEHPLIKELENFMARRYRNLDFVMGNAHFDLNPYNVWISDSGELYFSDLDNIQPAALAKDFFDVMGRYLRITDEGVNLRTDILELIYARARLYVRDAADKDLRFLLIRSKLGHLFDPDNGFSANVIRQRLDHLHSFVET